MYIIKLIHQYYYSLRHYNLYKNVTDVYQKCITYKNDMLRVNIDYGDIVIAQFRRYNNYYSKIPIRRFIDQCLIIDLDVNCFLSLKKKEKVKLPLNYYFTYGSKKELALYLMACPDNNYYN